MPPSLASTEIGEIDLLVIFGEMPFEDVRHGRLASFAIDELDFIVGDTTFGEELIARASIGTGDADLALCDDTLPATRGEFFCLSH